MKGKKNKDDKKKKRKDKNKGKDDNPETVSMTQSHGGETKSRKSGKTGGYGDSELGSQVPAGPEDDFVVGGEADGLRSSDKDKAGKKTKGSTDEPSGTSRNPSLRSQREMAHPHQTAICCEQCAHIHSAS